MVENLKLLDLLIVTNRGEKEKKQQEAEMAGNVNRRII